MCVPQAIPVAQALLSTALNVSNQIIQHQNEKANNKYKAAVAANNIRQARNQALQQKQLGIEQARKENIEKLKNAKILASKNAASGFDMNSFTNYINYDDAIVDAKSSASEIENSYNAKANNYFQRANDYLNNYEMQRKTYNAQQYSKAINALGSYNKVASNWYSKFDSDGGEYDNI